MAFRWGLLPPEFCCLNRCQDLKLSSKKAHNEVQKNHALINPHIGMTYNTKKWGYTLECKFLQMNKKNIPNIVDYVGIQQRGAIGIYLNFTRRF